MFGFKIAVNLDNIDVSFDGIKKIAQNSVKALIIYTLFLYNVAKDTFSAHERYIDAKQMMDNYYINKKLWESAEGKYGEDSTSAVVLISGNKSNLGTVINTNHELYEILGYEKRVVMGQNLSLIMPELIATFHNKFIQNYFAKSSTNGTYSCERIVFPQHCNGYLVPCSVLVRLVPNLDRGIQFIGFLNKAPFVDEVRKGENKVSSDDVILLLLDSEFKLHAFNKKFAEMLAVDMSCINIHKYLENDQKIDLPTYFPSVFSSDNIHSMTSDEGYQCQLDLSRLVEAFQAEVVDEIGYGRTYSSRIYPE